VRVLNKYRKKLAFKVQWRPLYDTLIHTHFSRLVFFFLFLRVYIGNFSVYDLYNDVHYRNTGPEGWRLRQRHFQTITSLVRSCRRFFPVGSALEIWNEFR